MKGLLCCKRLACMDQVLIKTDGDILFQGKTSFQYYSDPLLKYFQKGTISQRSETVSS